MIKTIRLIQFHNHTEDTDDRDARSVVGKWFILGEENCHAEFYDGEDDHGDSVYVDKECVSYFDSIEDYLRDDNAGYMVMRRLRYSTFDFGVEMNDENNIKWIA
jgi:hypothetical protein